MPKASPWKVLSSRTVYRNRWMRVREDKVITPTGSEGVYGVLESNDSVMVVVLNEKQHIYLIHTFRYPDQSWNWELPGGGSDRQNPAEASKRELEEETGIRASTWDKLGETLVCNGLMTEKMTTYLARGLSFGGEKEASDEQIADARFFSLDEIHAMVERGDINDG
ncbi:MAG: NUDIX domain-containing protein, partial [Candidatus Binatia bacterium]